MVFNISPFMEPAAQLAISSMRCWMAFRIPILDLYTDAVQKRMLETSRMHSTIIMIFVESLYSDVTDHVPLYVPLCLILLYPIFGKPT